MGCGGQAEGIFLEEGLPEPEDGGRGQEIVELAETAGGSRSIGSQEILHRTELLGSRPNVAGDEAVRDPGARTLSARLKRLS